MLRGKSVITSDEEPQRVRDVRLTRNADQQLTAEAWLSWPKSYQSPSFIF